MSIRVSTSSLHTGKIIVGNTGLGVRGADIRSQTATGTSGPGLLYNAWESGDNDTEFYLALDDAPDSGTLTVYEGGAFKLLDPIDGADHITYYVFSTAPGASKVALGLATATLQVGATLTSVQSERAATWGLRNAVSSTKAPTWSVRNALTSSKVSTWGVFAAVSKTQAATWTITTSPQASAVATWGIRAAVTSSASSTWGIHNTVQATKSPLWGVRNTVTSSISASYTILANSTSVNSTASATWTVLPSTPGLGSRVTSKKFTATTPKRTWRISTWDAQ